MLTSAYSLLRKTMSMYEQGQIQPIRPITRFAARNIEDAMRFMQKGNHIGKVVITMPEIPDELDSPQSHKAKLQLRDNASYLLVGGLGGIGQAIAGWMAEAGARECESVQLACRPRTSSGLTSSLNSGIPISIG
jgi:hypothetical protein